MPVGKRRTHVTKISTPAREARTLSRCEPLKGWHVECKIPGMRMLIIAALFMSVVVPNSSAVEPASQLPSEQQVLTFIGNTIDWYRQLPTSQRIGSDAADLFFLEDNRPTAIEIVRLSFQFGKAIAAIELPDPRGIQVGRAHATRSIRMAGKLPL